MITISFDQKRIERAKTMLALAPKEADRAAAAAINRTLTHVPKEMAKTVREKYIVRAGSVKKSLRKNRASAGKLAGEIISTGKTMPLTSFKIGGGRRGPMRVKVLHRGSPKPVKGLFARQFKKGYDGPMKRVGGARYPLKTPAGPSIPQMVGNEEIFSKWGDEAEEFLNKRFTHEIDFRFSKLFG